MIDKLNSMITQGEIREILMYIIFLIFVFGVAACMLKCKRYRTLFGGIAIFSIFFYISSMLIGSTPRLNYSLDETKEYVLSSNEYDKIFNVLSKNESGECDILVKSPGGEFFKSKVLVDINYVLDNSSTNNRKITIEKYTTCDVNSWGWDYSKDKYVVKYIDNSDEQDKKNE